VLLPVRHVVKQYPGGKLTEVPVKGHLKISAISLLAMCLLLSWRLYPQIHDKDAPRQQVTLQGLSPQELQMLRYDLRRQKQKLIADNLPMTESEAIKFWAVYQKYSDELDQVNGEKFTMLHSYAQNWRSISNDDAMIFMRRWLELDENAAQLRSKYLLLVKDVLPGKKAATFFQLDERISMMINLEFASQLPLLHGANPHQPTAPATP
jgi:hypothetical protein